MSDIIDQANDTSELFLRAALSNVRTDSSGPCQFCEERPVTILPNGCRSRFCEECAPIALSDRSEAAAA